MEKSCSIEGYQSVQGDRVNLILLRPKLSCPNKAYYNYLKVASFWTFGLNILPSFADPKAEVFVLSCWKKTCCFMITWQREHLRMYSDDRSLQ